MPDGRESAPESKTESLTQSRYLVAEKAVNVTSKEESECAIKI